MRFIKNQFLLGGAGIASALLLVSTPLRAAETRQGAHRADPERYSVQSPFWGPRIKHLVVSYVPYLIDFLENDRTSWKIFARFRATAEKLSGGTPENPIDHDWLDAALHNAMESMCYALMVDPGGVAEIIEAQKKIRAAVERWVPVILAAQEPDGYLCTNSTLKGYRRWTSGRGFDHHEGYQMGYFLEAAIAHYLMTGGTDRRLYDAATKTADLWCATLGGPPKLAWQPDHTEIKQALTRFGSLVNRVKGLGKGEKYLRLAEWIAENRGVVADDGYRQKDKPLIRQEEPYGHAVIAGYFYSGAAAVAGATGNGKLATALDRLWAGLVNRRMYLTGAIGTEGECFRQAYELPNASSLGESCANIANFLFQQNMALLHADAKYIDVAEQTLYNAVLGAVSLEEPKWQYFNPLDQAADHGRQNRQIDCCMGNLPRILLQLPSWIYSQDSAGLNVNLFIGSRVNLRNVAGVGVTMVQETNFPWDGKATVSVHPSSPRRFEVRLRLPGGFRGDLYTATPPTSAVHSVSINGQPVKPRMDRGYAVLDRIWRPGDRIGLELPLQVQRVRCDQRVSANLGRVALQYGPLTYVIESSDHDDLDSVALPTDAPLRAEWAKDLLGGVMTLRGTASGGKPITAVPYYARLNRKRQVWNHLATTYDGKTHRFYVNGKLALSRETGPLKLADTPLFIGQDPLGQKRYFPGTISQAAVFNTPLSGEQLLRLAGDISLKPSAAGAGQPVFEGAEYQLDGTNPVKTDRNIGITGNQPWTLCAWVKWNEQPKFIDGYGGHLTTRVDPGADDIGYGILGWGSSEGNGANFLYYAPNRALYAGFGGNDGRATENFRVPNRALVWIRE